MKLFVSYARVDKASCEPIIRELEKAYEVFYDQRLQVGERWREEIERRVAWCEGFVYMLTPESVASEYCRWEYDLAREGAKLIFPVLLQANTPIPDEMREIQIADFSEGLTVKAFSSLTAGIYRAEMNHLLQMIPPPATPPVAPQVATPHGRDALTAGLAALDEGRLDEALFKLRQARESGYDFGGYVNLERVIADVEARLEREAYDRRAELSYAPIAQLVSTTATREQGCEAFTEFRQEFPDYDPQDVAGLCEQPTPQPWLKYAFIVGAVITALGLIGAAIVTGGFGLLDDGETQQPSAIETPTQTVGQLARVLAEAGVSHNAEWETYAEEINGVEMALVPAGCFMMGSEDGDNDEEPVHEVCFEEPYWIDVYEVTNEQYGGRSPDCLSWSSDDNHPRVCIGWTDSQGYCESRGARLPTEAEWEYAARGPDSFAYPWGNAFVADNVVYAENDPEGTAYVGSKPDGVSWIGAFDLSGNVWEWVSDWYADDYYGGLTERTIDPHGPVTADDRVLRGGSWRDNSSVVRASNRNRDYPSDGNFGTGFRCARSYSP